MTRQQITWLIIGGVSLMAILFYKDIITQK